MADVVESRGYGWSDITARLSRYYLGLFWIFSNKDTKPDAALGFGVNFHARTCIMHFPVNICFWLRVQKTIKVLSRLQRPYRKKHRAILKSQIKREEIARRARWVYRMLFIMFASTCFAVDKPFKFKVVRWLRYLLENISSVWILGSAILLFPVH